MLDYDGLVDEIAEVFQVRLTAEGKLLIATDGSVVDTVAAWAVVVDSEDRAFSSGVGAEDQTPHRAEVEGLLTVFRALLRCTAAGCVHVLADCQSAMRVVQGGGHAQLLASRAVAMQELLRPRIDLKIWWVPSHGKLASRRWACPPCGEMVARALNARADRDARACATRRAQGSDRQRCYAARLAAFKWEQQSQQSFRLTAPRWADA